MSLSTPVSPRVRVAIMAKAPEAGSAKTRLAPALGLAGAAALAERMLAHAVAQAAAAGVGPITLWAAPDAAHPAFQRARLTHGVRLAVQSQGDIGQRMQAVFEASFQESPLPVLLMGTDAPALGADLLRQAAQALGTHDAVFVPAFDGGYVLVGLRAPAPALFTEVTWSTNSVMAQTRARAAAAGISMVELPAVPDIDEPDDLRHVPAGWLAEPVPGGALK